MTSMWVVLRTRRVVGEQETNERDLMMNDYGWGGGRKEVETKNP